MVTKKPTTATEPGAAMSHADRLAALEREITKRAEQIEAKRLTVADLANKLTAAVERRDAARLAALADDVADARAEYAQASADFHALNDNLAEHEKLVQQLLNDVAQQRARLLQAKRDEAVDQLDAIGRDTLVPVMRRAHEHMVAFLAAIEEATAAKRQQQAIAGAVGLAVGSKRFNVDYVRPMLRWLVPSHILPERETPRQHWLSATTLGDIEATRQGVAVAAEPDAPERTIGADGAAAVLATARPRSAA